MKGKTRKEDKEGGGRKVKKNGKNEGMVGGMEDNGRREGRKSKVKKEERKGR